MAILSKTEDLYLAEEMTEAEQRAIRRRADTGALHRIAPGMFTPLPEDEWDALLRRHRVRALAARFPDAVIGYRTAFDSNYSAPVVFLNYSYNKTVELPGMQIHLVKGAAPQPGDREMGGHKLFFPSEARMFLDNLSIDRSGKGRNAPVDKIEERLISICQSRGEEKLNELRDQARKLAPALKREREFALLDKIVGTALATRKDHHMTSRIGQSWSMQLDQDRIALFDRLVSQLRMLDYRTVADPVTTSGARLHFAFLESYFSNFIEGTKFEVSVARDIVLNGRIVENRPKDSHDVLGVFQQVHHPGWRMSTLSHTDAVLKQIQERHAEMMKMRPEVDPGDFKIYANVAGNTRFVEPRLVRGTLAAAVRRLPEVPDGFPRALLAMFILAEIHPFSDGNGRLARIMMNAELTQAGQGRIIVPSLLREDYLDCLRMLTREGNPDSFIKVMREAQLWTASFSYEDLDQVIEEMERCHAFEESRIDFKLYDKSGMPFGRLTDASMSSGVMGGAGHT